MILECGLTLLVLSLTNVEMASGTMKCKGVTKILKCPYKHAIWKVILKNTGLSVYIQVMLEVIVVKQTTLFALLSLYRHRYTFDQRKAQCSGQNTKTI